MSVGVMKDYKLKRRNLVPVYERRVQHKSGRSTGYLGKVILDFYSVNYLVR